MIPLPYNKSTYVTCSEIVYQLADANYYKFRSEFDYMYVTEFDDGRHFYGKIVHTKLSENQSADIYF